MRRFSPAYVHLWRIVHEKKKKLPKELDYSEIKGLRVEAQQKLNKYKPVSIGQASRISGVSPADINVLLVYLNI